MISRGICLLRFEAMNGQYHKRHVPYQNSHRNYTHYGNATYPRMSEQFGKNPQMMGEYPYQTSRRGQPMSAYDERDSRYNINGMTQNGRTKWHNEIAANRYLGNGNRVPNFDNGYNRQYSVENGITRDGEIHCEGVVRDGISLNVKRVHDYQQGYQGGASQNERRGGGGNDAWASKVAFATARKHQMKRMKMRAKRGQNVWGFISPGGISPAGEYDNGGHKPLREKLTVKVANNASDSQRLVRTGESALTGGRKWDNESHQSDSTELAQELGMEMIKKLDKNGLGNLLASLNRRRQESRTPALTQAVKGCLTVVKNIMRQEGVQKIVKAVKGRGSVKSRLGTLNIPRKEDLSAPRDPRIRKNQVDGARDNSIETVKPQLSITIPKERGRSPRSDSKGPRIHHRNGELEDGPVTPGNYEEGASFDVSPKATPLHTPMHSPLNVTERTLDLE